MKKISVLEPQQPAFKPRKRVAAYARVSMETERLKHSLSAQVSYYSARIQKNPEWIYAGVYADDSISGTGTDKRSEFNRLIADCDAGLINIVLVKSISRFARNTVDLLNTVRHLKDIGVDVWFEDEGIHSLDGDGESVPTDLIQNHYKPLGEKPLLYKGRALSEGFSFCTNFGQMLRCTRSIRIQNHTPLTIAFYR